eukprot:423646-Hanusia_phi.AAC.1
MPHVHHVQLEDAIHALYSHPPTSSPPPTPTSPRPPASPWNYALLDLVVAHDASTPLGVDPDASGLQPQLVDSQQPRARHWTKAEHDRFLQALALYRLSTTGKGRDGEKGFGLGRGVASLIARHVRTRTDAQVRSHAQKYFLQMRATQDQATTSP